jgi:hypothetical protein
MYGFPSICGRKHGSANLSVAALKSIAPIRVGAQPMGVAAATVLAATDLLADPANTWIRMAFDNPDEPADNDGNAVIRRCTAR